MSLKEIEEAMEKQKVLFGLKQALKYSKSKKSKKSLNVFVAKDVRPEILKKLEESGFKVKVLKTKAEISKQLGLDFESEVFMLK